MADYRERLDNLRWKMRASEVDLVAVGPGAHMRYLLGFAPHADERPCFLLVSAHGSNMVMPVLNADGSRQETDQFFHTWSDEEGPSRALENALTELKAKSSKRVSLDETMRADFALLLLGALPDASHVFTQDTVAALRMCKDDDEYAVLKENALINDRAFLAVVQDIKIGMSENEIGELVSAYHCAEGAKTEFCIIGSGGNGAFPHHATGERKVENGDAIVIDIGARKDGFPSDMTRMAVIGTPPDGYEDIHVVVEAAVQAALATARPGIPAKLVDKAARDVIDEAGYGKYFIHRTGHGLGIEIHEPPYITSVSETILEEGAVFSIEPGIYLPGRFGVRLEDIVILRSNGPEVLSGLSRDWISVTP